MCFTPLALQPVPVATPMAQITKNRFTTRVSPQPEDEDEEETMQLCPCLPCCPAVRTVPPSAEAARKPGAKPVEWLKLVVRWMLWVPAFPFVVLFSWTIPDCSKDQNK